MIVVESLCQSKWFVQNNFVSKYVIFELFLQMNWFVH